MDNLSRAGVVAFDADFSKVLRSNGAALLDTIAAYHGHPAEYRFIGPFASHAQALELRKALFAAAPGLEDVASKLRDALKGSCAVLVPKVGLDAFPPSQRAVLAYGLSVAVGNPTATDKKQVIWDVLARKRDSAYFSTFSETDGEAAYHTDTQYYPEPEPCFMLYVMEAARCGGGFSSVLDARALRADIEKNQAWVAEVLANRALPFRVPSAFVTGGDPDMVEATLAPIFAREPFIRYRRDTLAEGLLYFPEHADAAAHQALDAFEAELKRCPYQAEFFMPTDSLIFMDNHRGLHARTSFQDHQRHLLRIRMRTEAAMRTPTHYALVKKHTPRLFSSAN
jgi:alpha-ketoglutarate-dependent taurine dioxygenase